MNRKKELQEDCEEILRTLIARHSFLCFESTYFDVWDNNDAAALVADLISLIRKSSAIEDEMARNDWGK